MNIPPEKNCDNILCVSKRRENMGAWAGGGCSYLSIWIPEHVQNSDFLASQVPHIEITLRFKVKDYQLKMLFSATISKYVFHD